MPSLNLTFKATTYGHAFPKLSRTRLTCGYSRYKGPPLYLTNLTEFFILGKLSLFELNEKITNSAEEDIVVFTKTLDIMQKEKQRTKTTRKNEYSYK
jgi:hypothetical protein